MKKVWFYIIFILIICMPNHSEAITVTKNCENCNKNTQCTYRPINPQLHGLYCNECNKPVYINNQNSKKESHQSYLDERGICSRCGYNIAGDNEREVCNHIGTILRYVPNRDGISHQVRCDNCNTIINEKETCYPSQSDCEKCQVKKSATFEIPTKVFYIDQDGLKDVNSMEKINQIDINLKNTRNPSLSWTMSTMGATVYNTSNDASNPASDKTIKFWYNGSGFNATLEEKPKNLSGEVIIKITMKDDDVETTQTIRIIKSGIPKSNCTIYFKNNRVAIDGNELYLLIKTNYNDFSDDEVRKIREESPNEFPFYNVKNEIIELKSQNEDILKIENYELKDVTNGYINGYWAKVNVVPKELGQAKIYYKLTTEYTYMNHEPKENIREGTFFINVVEKVPESERNWDGNRSPITTPVRTESPTGGSSISSREDIDDNGENNRDTNSSGGLAMVGVIGLLIVAFIGSKMLNHR